MWTRAQTAVVMWIMQAMILLGNRAVALLTIFAMAVIVCCGVKDDRKGKG